MTLDEVKAICNEMNLVCKHYTCVTDWYIYTPNSSRWICCYYHLLEKAGFVTHNSIVGEPFFTDKDEFREGLKRLLKRLKEESIENRIKSLEKDFENDT